jgi:hypothetical protein
MHHQIQPKIDPLVCVERSVSAQAATVIKIKLFIMTRTVQDFFYKWSLFIVKRSEFLNYGQLSGSAIDPKIDSSESKSRRNIKNVECRSH